MRPGDVVDERYRRRWGRDRSAPPPPAPTLARRVLLRLFALLPWLAYAGLVLAGWWALLDGSGANDDLGIALLALALPCLFVAAPVSRAQRRWIRVRFDFEVWARAPSGGGGGLLDWLVPWW